MTSMFALNTKVALVTGSTRGLGLAMARALAQHGAKVAVNSRSAEASERSAEQLRGEGLDAVALPFD
ncbi:MAG: SDR family NAD(P)-dependent oxidoreductase, partial [Alphaproteobacteria bacterium]